MNVVGPPQLVLSDDWFGLLVLSNGHRRIIGAGWRPMNDFGEGQRHSPENLSIIQWNWVEYRLIVA